MINQATIKAGVEAAKKGIPMAGQKLAEFFSKEGMKQAGQQVGNIGKQVFSKEGMKQAGQTVGSYVKSTGKELYQRRGELASALGDDLTAVGKGVMKGPETIKAGARVVGDVTSKAAGKVGEAAVGMGAKVGGEAGAEGVRNLGRMAASPYAMNTGVGIAAEQLVPRIMGGVAPSLRESVVRQGVSQGIGMPVSAGLAAGGVNPTIATFGGQLAGQVAGSKATQAFVPPKYDTFGYTDAETGRDQKLGMIRRDVFESEGLKPGDQFDIKAFGQGPITPTGATKFTAEPESAQVVRPSTTDLSGVQAREALSERDKYEYRLKMAQIEKMPSTVMHMSPDSNNQTLASLAQSMMRSTSY
jgi:hypothetical protein